MRKEEGALIYSPSDLINFIENEFITWMDRYYLEFPGEVQPDEDREEDQIFQKLGYQYTRNDIDILYGKFLEIADRKKEINDEDLHVMAKQYKPEPINV